MIKKNVITPFEEIIKNTLYEEPSLILFELFPTLSHPSKSRFDAFFKKEKEVNNSKKNNKIRSSRFSHKSKENKMELNLKSIQNGMDKRTSLMLKNIPKNIKKKDIRNMIEKFGNINFLSISKDQNIDNFIIAYLNVINYKIIVPIYMGLRKHTFDYFGNKINIEIYYSKVQGKEELKKVFKNDYFGNK